MLKKKIILLILYLENFLKFFQEKLKNTIDNLNNISYYNNDNLNTIISKETKN